MGKAINGFCAACQVAIKGNNWSRHLQSKAHLEKSKGKFVKKKLTTEAPILKRGRPKSSKLDPPLASDMLAHVRARGLALYYWKASKLFDDGLKEKAKLVRALVVKVRS
jgi:hypothetical protein